MNVIVSLVISSNSVDIFIFNNSFTKNLVIHDQKVTNFNTDLQLGCNKLHSSVIMRSHVAM